LALSLALTGPGEYSIEAALGLNAWWTPQLSGIVLAAPSGLVDEGCAKAGVEKVASSMK
jgi:hypothetical protein